MGLTLKKFQLEQALRKEQARRKKKLQDTDLRVIDGEKKEDSSDDPSDDKPWLH